MSIDVIAWGALAHEKARTRELGGHVTVKSTLPPHPGGGYVIDVDGHRAIAQFIVWPSGAVEAGAINVETERRELFQDAVVTDVAELDRHFEAFLRAVAELEHRAEGPPPGA